MQSYSFRLGDLECYSLYDNRSTSTLKEIFSGISPSDFMGINLDEPFQVGFNCLYIKQNNKHILVDTGTGQGELLAHDLPSFIDSYPEELIQSNKRLIARMLKTKVLMFGSHLTFPGLARVSESIEGLEWQWVS